MVGVALLGLELKEALAHAGKVQTRLPEPSDDKRHFVITRDKEIENTVVGIDCLFDAGYILRFFGRPREKQRQYADTCSGDLHSAHRWVRDRAHLPRIHA